MVGATVLPGGRAWRIIKEMMKSRGGMFVARVPKFLNLSAAGRARLALPPAKIALVAASCLFAVVGVGAFVVALPGMDFSPDAIVDDAAREQPEKDAQAADASEQSAEGADVQEDAAATEGGEADARDGAAASSADALDSGDAAAASSSGASAAGGSAASSGSSSSGSGGSSSSGSSAGSGSSGGSAAPDPVPSQNDSTPSDPFSAAPTAAQEQEFRAFLAGWYARLGACESEAAAGDASTCWSGYYAVRDYVRSNGSRWCGAQENLIGAYRCLAWYAESGDEANLAEYRSYKAAVSL